jgi:ATP diphosphatase
VFIQPEPPLAPGHGISTPTAVVRQWEHIKARERAVEGKERDSVLDGIPRAMPALTRAHELGTRAASVGFDWPDSRAVLEKVREELAELEVEVQGDRAERISEELGDVLFALAQFARKAGLDPEATLRAADTKFSARFRALEGEVAAQGREISALGLDELEHIWQELKRPK